METHSIIETIDDAALAHKKICGDPPMSQELLKMLWLKTDPETREAIVLTGGDELKDYEKLLPLHQEADDDEVPRTSHDHSRTARHRNGHINGRRSVATIATPRRACAAERRTDRSKLE